ncbi:hypothetical protein KIW84_072984 [Lathyrus oleraceus]|uniref:Uncharacterized protein n=1 Tax=Pisum sativum TaxID=3888 RepID=A0A9D4ZVY0_PEA|nr:hypothetical protein KIW84_072984 [Pisum sativum]
MARPFEKIDDICARKDLWKDVVKVHHNWTVIINNKEHLELIFIDACKTWCVIVATTDKLKASGNGWYYQAGVDDPLELPLVLDKFLYIKHVFKVKWKPRWGNVSVMPVNRDKDMIKKLMSLSDVCENLTSTEVNDDQILRIKESVDEATLVDEWNIIIELEITSKLNPPPLPSVPSVKMDFVTPEKQPQLVTPINHGKRGAIHGSSESPTVKDLDEGE